MEKRNIKNAKLFYKIRTSKYFELTGLVLLMIVFSLIVQTFSGNFFTFLNFKNILMQIVVYGILACALTFPLINGTFDLSIESTCALGGTCSALLVSKGIFGITTNLLIAILVTLLICGVVGVINGLFVAYTDVDPFIITLGTQIAVRGVVYIMSNNQAISQLSDSYRKLSTGNIFGVSYSVIIMIMIFILVAIVLEKTTFGRKTYAIGGNYQAAYISGIKVRRIRFITYLFSAGLAALAGILNTARVMSATPNAANGYTTIAISACAIGGVSLSGGKGTVIGVFLGSLMMGMITNGMNLMYIGSNWQFVVRGILMIAAVFYAQWFNKLSQKTIKSRKKH